MKLGKSSANFDRNLLQRLDWMLTNKTKSINTVSRWNQFDVKSKDQPTSQVNDWLSLYRTVTL